VYALQQRLEVQAAAVGIGDDYFSIDNGAPGETRPQGRDDLGEVPGHRALVPAADLDLVAVTKETDRKPSHSGS
jgi:hypothetical protein